MTLLKDLLALREVPAEPETPELKIQEARSGRDLHELIDKWVDANKAYSWEGSRGIRNLVKLVSTLDSNYRDLDDFFTDNPGAIEAVLEWIQTRNVPEWKESLEEATGGDEDDEDNDGGPRTR